MSVAYYDYYFQPLIGPETDIRNFWREYRQNIVERNGERCVRFNDVTENNPVLAASIHFPDVVFYSLGHVKIDTNIGWFNEIYSHGKQVIIREEDGSDYRPAVCSGLTILFSGFGDEDPDRLIRSMRMHGNEWVL